MIQEPNMGRRLLRAAGLMTLLLVGTPAVLMLRGGLEIAGSTPRLSAGRFAFWLAGPQGRDLSEFCEETPSPERTLEEVGHCEYKTLEADDL